MEKDYVSLEQKQCPCCTDLHSVGVLLHKRMKKTLERTTVTGYAICPKCDEKFKEGFIGLVECDESKSTITDGKVEMENAYRTGTIAYVKRGLFTCFPNNPFIFVGIGTIQKVNELISSIEE